MGCDLIMAWLIHDNDITPDWDAGKEKLKEIAETNLKAELDEGYLDPDGASLEDTEIIEETTYQEALEAIEFVRNAHDRRDFSSVTLGHITMLMSGGPSYGDEPTEAFSYLDTVGRLPNEVLKAIGLYHDAIPDYKAFVKQILDLHPEILPSLIGLNEEFNDEVEARLKEV